MRMRTLLVALAVGLACGSGSKEAGTTGAVGAKQLDYVVLAWNDLGMHCLNPSYDKLVILPPYNTLWAQVVQRGSPPRIVTQGITVEYEILGNTYSYGKGSYGQFWDFAPALFHASPQHDHGLNLVDPAVSNGLSGSMALATSADHFEAVGIPLVPVDDAGTWNPYQVAQITVKDASGAVLVRTTTTAPTSDELNCAKCHGADPFKDILARHDAHEGTTLGQLQPVLCASCHASPALGSPTRIGGRPYLSEAIHSFHGGLATPPACYDCHPGQKTQCSRSLPHTAADGNCTNCHGALADVGASTRVPWVNEPLCAKCHAVSIPQVPTGSVLYRNAVGHGGVSCPACHGSPHAMRPSRVVPDDQQVIDYQGKAKTLGSCGVCHGTSRGAGDLGEFGEAHGGTNPEHPTACHVCHTVVTADTARWPHAFQWKAR